MNLIFSAFLHVAPQMTQFPNQEVEDDGLFEKVRGAFVVSPFGEIQLQVLSSGSSNVIDNLFGNIPSESDSKNK